MVDGRGSIAARVEAIAAWRREREQRDLYGLGPDVAARNRRTANGLEELAAYIRSLDESDERLATISRLAFSGDRFDPGATMLHELGRFRFHDSTATIDGFVTRMTELAELDASERDQFGGPQVPGDNPWRPGWLPPDEEEDNW